MIVIGVDPHKRSHTAVAVNGVTAELLGEVTMPANDDGHLALLGWARQMACERRWAIEDCRHVSRRLERALVAAGEMVVRVPPKLMAGARRSARQAAKSDPIDARAVALAALREPELPAAHLDDASREVKLLLDDREDLVAERTRAINRLRWHLHELGLEHDIPAKALNRYLWLDRLAAQLNELKPTMVVEVAADLVGRIRSLTTQINSRERQIGSRMVTLAPALLAVAGCGALTAAKITGEVAGADRFATDDKLAMHAGVAPLDCSSGRSQRHRLNRKGNRQLNAAIHRIAVTQIRMHPPAKDYLERKMNEGKSKREALRCLKRHIVRTVYHSLKTRTPVPDLT